MVEQLSSLWKLSCDHRDAIDQAIRHRDMILAADSKPWSVIQPLLMLQHRDTILAAAQAWAVAEQFPLAGVDFCRNRIASWPADRLDPAPLLTGQDLIAKGHKPGPAFKPLLGAVRAAQLDGEIGSQAEALKMVDRMIDRP
jgi:hypothetical protein